ncbi:MAG TPA: sugar ABC transporter ATP-binding protein [Firmicutes bacterium]|nr:sugar ABC transporter ATP-binding protein [Bacillota bacterium]
MRDPDALLEVRGLKKAFGGVVALRGIDLTLERRQIIGLVGDNGAGKSTLIKIISGVYPPDEGEIQYEGKPIRFSSPMEARGVGIETVYQHLALIPQMSILRNFFLGKEMLRRIGPFGFMDFNDMRGICKEALEGLGIRVRCLDEDVSFLSGGERQAVAIARALHFGAKLLILDEPTAALSVRETETVLNYIIEARNRGLAVIFITHSLHQVYPVADRLVILEHGRKIGDFKRDEVALEDLTGIIRGTQTKDSS